MLSLSGLYAGQSPTPSTPGGVDDIARVFIHEPALGHKVQHLRIGLGASEHFCLAP